MQFNKENIIRSLFDGEIKDFHFKNDISMDQEEFDRLEKNRFIKTIESTLYRLKLSQEDEIKQSIKKIKEKYRLDIELIKLHLQKIQSQNFLSKYEETLQKVKDEIKLKNEEAF